MNRNRWPVYAGMGGRFEPDSVAGLAGMRSVVGDVSTGTIFKGVTPFWVADIIRLALLVSIPALALYLPSQMG